MLRPDVSVVALVSYRRCRINEKNAARIIWVEHFGAAWTILGDLGNLGDLGDLGDSGSGWNEQDVDSWHIAWGSKFSRWTATLMDVYALGALLESCKEGSTTYRHLHLLPEVSCYHKVGVTWRPSFPPSATHLSVSSKVFLAQKLEKINSW